MGTLSAMKRGLQSLIIFLALCAVSSAASGQATPPTQDNSSGQDIVLGMSAALSGPAADLGTQMRRGILAGLERANRAGGIHGRTLQLIALDDGYEPDRAAPNMRSLLEKDKVLAVIGNVGTPTAIAAIPIVDERKTLLFAPFTGAGVLRKHPPDRYVINYRASYAEEIGSMIDALIDQGGLKVDDIAFFTQRDGYGDSGFAGGVAALKRHGLKDRDSVLHVRYDRNTLAVEGALASLLGAEHEPRAIIMVGAYRPCAKFIKLARDAGINAVFLNVSFVGSESLSSELAGTQADVMVTQVVPYPRDRGIPIVAEYQDDLKTLDPSASPTFGSLEGYIDARILLASLQQIPGPPTREGLIDAMEQMGEFDIGIGSDLQLDAANHQACHIVWPTILRDGVFVPFRWTQISDILRKEAAQ